MTNVKLSSFFLKSFFFIAFFLLGNQSFSQYKISQIIEENKVSIKKPYKYDGFKMNEFTFEQINKNIPIEFVAFENQKYKLIFCTSDYEEQVIVSIYDFQMQQIQ